jgi:hypothetical protein
MADAVLEILKVIQGDIAGLKTDMGSVKVDSAGVKTEVRVHSRTLDILLQEGRLLRARCERLRQGKCHSGRGGSNPPRPHLRHEVSELTVRVEMIEERGKPEH